MASIMAKETMAYVVTKFYPYFWHKFGFPIKKDTESECEELVKKLRDAVWVHRIVSFRYWHPFVEMNLIPMVSSPEMYASCIFFMVSTTINSLHNRYEAFITTCSLVTAVAAYVYDKGYHEFLDYSPTILKVFFEEFHEDVFEKFKIWHHLHEYLITNNYSEAYDVVENKTKGNPLSDVIFQLDFVRGISLKIKSKIPFSERAAVYHQTLKVLKCFETEGTSGLGRNKRIDEETLSKVIKEMRDNYTKEPRREDVKKTQAQSAEDLTTSMNKQITTKPETIHSNIGSFSNLNQVKDLNLQTNLGVERIFATYKEDDDLKTSPPKSSKLKDLRKPIMEKEDAIISVKKKDAAIALQKRNSSFLWEKPLRKWEKGAKTASEESASSTEEFEKVRMNQARFKEIFRQACKEWLRMEDGKKSASNSEGFGEFNMKQAQINEKFRQACREWLQMEDGKENASTMKAKETNLKQTSSYQLEKELFRADVDVLRIKGREEKAIAMEEVEEKNLKRVAIHQSEQFPQNQKNTLEMKIENDSAFEMEGAKMFLDLEQSLENLPEKLLNQFEVDASKTVCEGNASSIKEMAEINLKQISANTSEEQLLRADKDILKMKDCKERAFAVEEDGEINFKMASTHQSKEQLHQAAMDVSGIKSSGDCFSTTVETLKIASKHNLTDHLEEQMLQADVDTLKIENKQNVSFFKETDEIKSGQATSHQLEEKFLLDKYNILKIKGSEQSIAALEEIEENNLKRDFTDQSENYLSKELVLAEKGPEEIASAIQKMETVLQQDSTDQSKEQSVQADLDESKVKDSEKRASTLKKSEEIGLTESERSTERFLLDDVDESKIKCDKQGTLVESNVGDILSDDDCQLEADNLVEDEYSDTGLLEAKDANENTTTPKNSKKKMKRSKPKQQKGGDSEPDLGVPSTEAVAHSLMTIFQNSRNSLRDIYEVLEISRDD